MSVQTVQQNVPKQTARGHFPSHRVNYSDSPISIQASKVDLPLRKGDVSIQPGDGAAYPRRRDDRADTDTQSSTDDQDVMIQHKALVTHFNNFPDHMENPYARLEQDKWVLEVDDDDQTIFHRMAKQIKDLEKKRENVRKEQWIRGIYKIIPWVIGKNPNLLDHTGGNPNQGDQAGEPNALEFAAKRCVPIAYCMLNLLLDQTTQEILRQQCDGTACRVNLKHPLIAYAKETRLEGSECPHGKADEILEFHDQLKLKLQRASQQTQSSKSSLHYIIARYCEAPDCNAVKELVRLSGADVIVPPRGNSSQRLLHLAVEKFQRPKEQDHEALNSLKDIIKTIVEVCPQALYEKDDKHKTAYEALLLHKANQEPTGKGIAGELQRRVLEVLKEAYIGDNMVDHNVKINSLYPGGVEELKICLDLGSSRAIGKNYVKAITDEKFDKFRFETCLSYVSLPPRKYVKLVGGKPDDSDFLDTYEVIFDFLERRKVKKIFKIIVNDLIGPPHSDQSIVDLTKRFHIEHWEWKKLDINSDTILKAAPNVKTVVLHSSGNFSALQGWACKHGLAKLQKLESVNVKIHKGLEDVDSLTDYRDVFKKRLERRFAKNAKSVKVKVGINDAVPYSSIYPNDPGHEELVGRAKKNHDWLNHMSKFCEGMRNYDAPRNPIVRVALIDDGIDPEKTNFRVHEGRTFDEMGDTGLDNYYVDPGQHGTIMGRLISKMCPNVHLYVARLKRAPGSDIPPTAAKAAIYWALHKNVDIISMSWTIPAKGPNPKDTEEFQVAIAEAIKQKKLLFCALRESEDALIEQGFYPVGLDQVFKIGSATRSGNLVKTSSGDGKSVQFILPGLDVLSDNEENVQTLNGSSVATALASGLAGIILFCADLVDQDAASYGKAKNYSESLRDINKMRSVFENMSRKSNEGKFPEVQRYFKITGKDPNIDDIKDIVTSLTSGLP